MYREPAKGLQILLSRTQAGPGRAVKEEQEEISPNHVQAIYGASVFAYARVLLFLSAQEFLDFDNWLNMSTWFKAIFEEFLAYLINTLWM